MEERAFKNARFVLEKLAGAKRGDQILILADDESLDNARILAACAKAHAMKVFIADVEMYGGDEGYDHLPVMEPLRQAILNSDITFMTTPQIKTSFRHYLGKQTDGDSTLLGHSKRFTLEIGGLTKWELNEEEIMRGRLRAQRLFAMLKRADGIRITTRRGTNLTCAVGNAPDGMYPVLGIIPFYSEVAIVPAIGSVSGVAVIDGASERAYHQRGFPIRPNLPGHREIHLEPMRLTFQDSILTGYTGARVQVDRMDTLMRTVSPVPRFCDEVGIVTTTSVENDQYGWQVDGSHQSHCVHVAIGNNDNRKEIIHAMEHIDFDMHDPDIWVDSVRICQDGVFDDSLIG